MRYRERRKQASAHFRAARQQVGGERRQHGDDGEQHDGVRQDDPLSREPERREKNRPCSVGRARHHLEDGGHQHERQEAERQKPSNSSSYLNKNNPLIKKRTKIIVMFSDISVFSTLL